MNMTRAEVEHAILEKVEEIRKIYHEYSPDGGRVNIDFNGDNYMYVNNCYYDPSSVDRKLPVCFFVTDYGFESRNIEHSEESN